MLSKKICPALGLVFAGAVIFGAASTATACPPKWSNLRGTIESGEGTVDVRILARASNVVIRIRAEGVSEPLSGEYRVVLNGEQGGRELTSFALILDQSGVFEDTITIEDDVREYLLGVNKIVVMDGTNLLGDVNANSYGGLRLRGRHGNGVDTPAFRLRGRAVVRFDGTSRFKFEARALNGEANGSLTFRMSGSGDPLDITVDLDETGSGFTHFIGRHDLVTSALGWDEVIVLDGAGDELARMPLECR